MKTLIAYSTKHGAAEECAKILVEKINGECDLVDLKISNPANLEDYDKIIIGSSIYVGQAQQAVMDFCQNNKAVLSSKPLGLYLVCMTSDIDVINMTLISAYTQELVEKSAISAAFGGKFFAEKMNFMEKMMIKMITKKEVKEGKMLKPFDGKSDLSTISEEKISQFAEKINLL